MDYESRVKQAEANLANVYKPQTDFYNKQMAEMPAMFQNQRSALDQARVNAFRQIETNANSRGMFFSGQPIQKQLEYNFGTYDPSLARIGLEEKSKKSQLEQALITLGMQKNQQARGWVDSQIKEEIRAAEKARDRADTERRHRQSLAASYARSSSSANDKYLSQFKISNKKNGAGYMFTGPNGRPISMYQYASTVGAPMEDLLKNSASKYDKQAYNYIQIQKKAGFSENEILRRVKSKYSALF